MKEIGHLKGLPPIKGSRILTPKEYKDILKYVQNVAKKSQSRIYKTNELIVLFLARGISVKELIRLNIEDMPFSHHENKIIVHNQRDGKTREVYLLPPFDDVLETKIKAYWKEFREDAKEGEPFIINRYDNRCTLRQIYIRFEGRNDFIGLAEKAGIKKLTPGLFRRTEKYQLVGGEYNNQKQQKPKKVGITLKKFIRRNSKTELDKLTIDILVKRLNNANDRKQITLPKHIGHWRSGQPKYYDEITLISNWHKYQEQLPFLPKLKKFKIEHTNIDE